MKYSPRLTRSGSGGLTAIGFGLAAALALIPGCHRERLATEVAEFPTALDTGLAAVTAYYSSLNEKEYDLYFQMLELDPEFAVGDYIVFTLGPDSLGSELAAQINENGTAAAIRADTVRVDSPLKRPPFSEKAVETRVRILQELGEYARNLASLAEADGPQRFQAGMSDLECRLGGLLGKIEAASGDTSTGDTGAARYIPPLSTFVKIVGGWHLEAKRWKAIREAIVEARPSVDTLLDKVAEDLDTFVEPVLATGQDDLYTQAIYQYNLQRKDKSQSWRHSALQQIREYKAALDAVRQEKPSSIPRQLKSAHAALVAVAMSGGRPEDLAQLKVELATFKEDVDQLREAVTRLRGKEEGESQ